MTDRAISPLRQRMTIRGFKPKTQTGYLCAVRDFTAFLDRTKGNHGSKRARLTKSRSSRCRRSKSPTV